MGTLLVTGGAGFIGSNLVRHALAHTADRLVVVDKLTYAGSLLNLDGRARRSARHVRARPTSPIASAVARVFADAPADAPC